MSNIFLCVDCGQIDCYNNLAFYEVNTPDNEIMKKIININKLGAFKCPTCGSSKILHSKPVFIVESTAQATVYTSDLPESAKILEPPIQEEIPPRTTIKHTNECDTCKKSFTSKVAGSTRCPECIKKTLKI